MNKSEHENGYIYSGGGICVFEDTQESSPTITVIEAGQIVTKPRSNPGNRYYSWVGDWANHDSAEQSPIFDTFIEAQQWAESRK